MSARDGREKGGSAANTSTTRASAARTSTTPASVARTTTTPASAAYILKMFPRFSETFILDELLELERQGVRLRVFSLKEPEDREVHGGVARLRARITYVPEPSLRSPEIVRNHVRAFLAHPRRYVGTLRPSWKRRDSSKAFKRFLQAGYIAGRLAGSDVTHVHAHFASVASSVAAQVDRLSGIGYSFTAHAKDIYTDTVTEKDLSGKVAGARFAVTVSDYNLRYLTRFADASRLVRIYNGLDLDRFRAAPSRRDELPLILGVGRLVEKKGFADLVDACGVLRDRGVAFRCRIVGKGDREQELRGRVDELGLQSRVELVGPMTREKLLGLYPRASVVVAPCVVGSDGNRDGLPTVLIEAMALGVPVISTPVTGIPELVEHERTGLLVPEHDPVAVADAIERLLRDPLEGEALACAGRTRVEQRFDLRRNVAQLRALIEGASA